jgi:hypothetical protein
MKRMVLAACIVFGSNVQGSLLDYSNQEQSSPVGNSVAQPTVENELFDFETGNTQYSDFFKTDRTTEDTERSHKPSLKERLHDYYNYFILYTAITYLDFNEWALNQWNNIKRSLKAMVTRLGLLKTRGARGK